MSTISPSSPSPSSPPPPVDVLFHPPSSSSSSSLPLTPVKQLASPRGVLLLDEMTKKTATLQHIVHNVTYYYSTVESAVLDWSVLQHIGVLLADLQKEDTAQGTATEREIHKQRAVTLRQEIAQITFDLASQRIIGRDYEHAVPAGLRCLRTLQILYGESSTRLVPAYLLLGEANLRLGRTNQAEEFLSMSSYILSKSTEPLYEVKSRLYRNFGKLYLAQKNSLAAVEAFSKDILYSSQAQGPESLLTSPGYFYLGKAFENQNKTSTALACYDKVVQIWFMHMTNTLNSLAKTVSQLVPIANDGSIDPHYVPHFITRKTVTELVGPVEIAEGLDLLESIRLLRTQQLGPDHIAVAEAAYTRALVIDQLGKVRENEEGYSAENDRTVTRNLLDQALPILRKEKVSRYIENKR